VRRSQFQPAQAAGSSACLGGGVLPLSRQLLCFRNRLSAPCC
jgi:hypothetical protein